MERLATGKQNANAGDRSSYVAMADTFRLGLRWNEGWDQGRICCDGLSGNRYASIRWQHQALLSRLQELAVLGANRTNTTADHAAIDAEAEAIGDEFNRLLERQRTKEKTFS
jgi:flagellin